MEWKEKATDILFVGVSGLVGGWIVKKFWPSVKNAKRMYGLLTELDWLKKEVVVMKERQFKILYTAPDPIFICNPKGEVTFVNPAWLQMTGIRTEKDALGFGFMKAIPEEDRDNLLEESERLVEHPGSYEGIVRFQHIGTTDIVTTMCRSEPYYYNGEHIETIGRLSILK